MRKKNNHKESDEKSSALAINKKCEERTQISEVQKAIKNPEDERLVNEVFTCIYLLFQERFIKSVVEKYGGCGLSKGELEEMAKDAFQAGLEIFFEKTKKQGLEAKALLYTIIYAFSNWQFRKLLQKHFRHQCTPFDEITFTMSEEMNHDKFLWDEVLEKVLSEKEFQFHQAIRKLKREWQRVLYAVYFDHISRSEIAEEMKVSVEHIYNIILMAKKKLKKLLPPDFSF